MLVGKTPTELKLYILSFLALGTLNHDNVDVMCIVLSSYMGDRIRRMSMTKKMELLNLWKDCPSLYNVSNFS
jgi:hypothetical protein